MTRLPDEILKEILVPPLRIPDVEFSSTGRASESPFGRTVRNSSSLLLVSKQWMRVATPLLYEVVIMRSTAQAQALAYAIKSNKAFGMFIKKLRMEGGFGKSPAHFIALAPNIRELFVTLDLWSSDSPSGLCSMLSGMNLCRVVINHQDGDIKNAKATQLWKSLCTCIPHWSNLEILEYHSTYAISINGKGKYWELAALLKASPSVKHVVFTYVPQLVLAKMALFTSLETVSVELMSSQQRGFISNNHTLRKLVKVRPERNTEHKTTPKVSSIASVVAGFKPLEKVPKHTAKPIWDLIFSFATHSYYAETPPSGKPLTAPNSSPSRSLCYLTARTLCLVSKSFREIARRHLFSIVQVESRRRFSAFTDTINDNDALARLVRVLRVKFLRSHETDCDNRMTQLLPKLTSLVCLDVPLIDLRQLKLLKPPASTNLQTLDVRLAACSESGRDTVNLGVLGGLTYFRCTFDSWESLRRPKLPLTLSVHLPNLTSFSIGMHDSEDTLDAFWTNAVPYPPPAMWATS
ncbi:hypothetical protein BD410DRAFT_834186 [Rickenella mellea]|uniref:Uncharacterized protein n=1 Tax=Rickenella mellea TaxID=50990 RepID=A0A4R5XHP0_9AGAM|nr:hypothetical protein BD410DRAFT_834186 [Rickenella mellea]